MQYIIMCGGRHPEFEIPKPLLKINGESLVERTIRLLREFGATDISVSTSLDDNSFDWLDVLVLKQKNDYSPDEKDPAKRIGYGVDAFFPTEGPVCYLCGDVWYSRAALKTIIDSECNDFLMFGTRQPLPKECPKWEEPMGFKVIDHKMLDEYCEKFKYMDDHHMFARKGMSGELYRLIEGFDPNRHIVGPRFVTIHDFACDIDHKSDIQALEKAIKDGGGD